MPEDSSVFRSTCDSMIRGSSFMEVNHTVNVTIGPEPDHIGLPALRIPTAFFTGRDIYLEKLKSFFPMHKDNVSRKLLLLHGMQGIGKTQICLKFIQEFRNEFSHIFWINASSKAFIAHNLKQISKEMHIGMPPSVETTLNWISGLRSKWILVFDDADIDYQSLIEDFIPSGDVGYILITSRNSIIGQTIIFELQVNQMQEEEAAYMLMKCGNCESMIGEYREPVKSIVYALKFNPLAIDQAGAYMQACKCTASEYLGLYMKHMDEISGNSDSQSTADCFLSAYCTWLISMEKIESRATDNASPIGVAAQYAIILYKLFAFLHNENIPEEAFRRAAKNLRQVHMNDRKNGLPLLMSYIGIDDLCINQAGEWNELKFKAGIQTLLMFSLIKKEYNGMYTVHPLMNMWNRNRLSGTEVKVYGLKARALIISAAKADDIDNYLFSNVLVLHIMACHTHVQDDEYFDDERSSITYILERAGEYEMAEKYALLSLQNRTKVLGSEHLDTLDSKYSLALACQNKGRWDEAKDLQLQVLRGRETLLGSDHPHTLTSMLCIALIHVKQGKFRDGLKLQMQVAEAQERSDHRSAIMTMANVASTYMSMGLWTEAAEMQKKVVDARRSELGDSHPDVLESMNNLARIYYFQGRFEEAELLQMCVTRAAEDIFGGRNHMCHILRSNLASTMNKLQKLDAAEKLERQLLDEGKLMYGMNHSYTFVFLCNLAETLLMQKKLDKAEEFAVSAVEIAKATFGSNETTKVNSAMSILGLVYQEQGKLDEAEKLQVSIVETSKQYELHSGIMLMDHLISMNNLALTYWKQGRWEEAERLQLQIVEECKSELGSNHPDTLVMVENLLITYWQSGKLAQSKSLVIHIMEAKMAQCGAEHPETLWAIFNLGMVYQSLGNLYHAEKLVAYALKGMKEQQGNEHPDTQNMIKARIRLLIQLFMVDVIDLFRIVCQSESLQVLVFYVLIGLFN